LTIKEWERFPLLLSRSQLVGIGLSEKDIRYLIDAGQLKPWRKGRRGYAKYRKTEVAKILRLEV